LRSYARHFPLENYFKFTMVRNPWDRAVSQIEYLRRSFPEAAALFSGRTFKENLRIYCQTRMMVRGHDLSACQTDYLIDDYGAIRIDFIGRFESLQNDFEKICEQIGILPAPVLEHAFNSERHEHYSSYYDQESAGWIRHRFARDIDNLGYQFDPPVAPLRKKKAVKIKPKRPLKGLHLVNK
jgi:hypothetical protein